MYKLLTAIAIVIIAGLGVASLQQVAAAGTPTAAANSSSIPTDTPDLLVSPAQGPSVNQRLGDRAKSSWPWYITRAAGLIAALALVLLIASGVGLITGVTFRFLEPLTAWATHKAIGLVFAGAVVIHVVALLFDTYVPFSLAQAFVPFVSPYKPVTIAGYHLGSLWVAFGVFALYALAAITITSLVWIDKKPHTWKLFHFLSYFVLVMVFFHALYIGTDLTHGILRFLWIVFGILGAVLVVIRLGRKGR